MPKRTFFQTVQNPGRPGSQFILSKILNPGPSKNAGSEASLYARKPPQKTNSVLGTVPNIIKYGTISILKQNVKNKPLDRVSWNIKSKIKNSKALQVYRY
jgi:hypothetical protein